MSDSGSVPNATERHTIDYACIREDVLYHGTFSDLDETPKATWSYELNGERRTETTEITTEQFALLWNGILDSNIIRKSVLSDPESEMNPIENHIINISYVENGTPNWCSFSIPQTEDDSTFLSWLDLLQIPKGSAGPGNDEISRPPIDSGYDVVEMQLAMERAREEVDDFITELLNPTGKLHSIKAPIEQDGETEHFWLSDVSIEDGVFVGTIDNDPGRVQNVKLGQVWTVHKEDISDWMFMKDGKMHGNYTLRPLLATLPESEAARIREMLPDE